MRFLPCSTWPFVVLRLTNLLYHSTRSLRVKLRESQLEIFVVLSTVEFTQCLKRSSSIIQNIPCCGGIPESRTVCKLHVQNLRFRSWSPSGQKWVYTTMRGAHTRETASIQEKRFARVNRVK